MHLRVIIRYLLKCLTIVAFSTLIYSDCILMLTSVEGEIGIAGCSKVGRLYSQIFHSNRLTYNSIGISEGNFNSDPF